MSKDAIAKARAASAARREATQTPVEVRQAFLAAKLKVGELEVAPLTLGKLWLLEDLGHPLASGMKEGQSLTLAQTAQAILVFTDEDRARNAMAEAREVFDLTARELAAKVPPGDVAPLVQAVMRRFVEGMSTVPGADGNPPKAAAP